MASRLFCVDVVIAANGTVLRSAPRLGICVVGARLDGGMSALQGAENATEGEASDSELPAQRLCCSKIMHPCRIHLPD